MRTLKILFTLLFLTFALIINAQTYTVKGKVLGPDNLPVKNAIVSLSGLASSVTTNDLGEFEIETNNENAELSIEAEGFYSLSQFLLGRQEINFVLVPSNKPFYTEEYIFPFRKINKEDKTSSAVNLNEKDFGEGNTIESALAGNIAGLRVVNKSGMPGEGAYFNLRGIRTLNAENSPLIVINGIPYLPDMNTSPIIGGYSKSIFNPYSLHNLHNITVLKGSEASMYGSMGSNGVILIETDALRAAQLETNISFYGQYGVNWNNKRIPLLGVNEYKNYLMDIGVTQYDNMADLFNYFPFLVDDPTYFYNYIYNNNTNWQKEIMSPSFTTDNLFRVEGGDAIAKYDISLGYLNDGGVLDGTERNRYNTQINTNILLGRNFEVFATIGAAYLDGHLMEQGMVPETNPMLAAYYKAPVLHPYKKDADGNILNVYDTYRYDVSNPVAIVNSTIAKYRMYDINSRIGLSYNLNDLYRFSAIVGLYYNYSQENVFIPGKSSQTILPLNYGLNENTVRAGIAEGVNMFYNLNGSYNNTFNDIHKVNALVGWQTLTSRREYDAGEGANTANDFYQTLNTTEPGPSRSFFGYIDKWNWMNFYGHVDYTYNNLIKGSFNISVDGSSSSGVNASRFGAFPSAGITLMAKNTKFLINSSNINLFNIRAEYGLTGNSRFSSNYGKSYYQSARYQELAGIVRSNIPNTNLKWETNKQLNLGVDFSFFRNRLELSFDYYDTRSSNVVFAQPILSVYGSDAYYDNSAKIKNNGIELSLQASLIYTKDFEWIIGGNIATQNSKVTSLGNVNERIHTISDGAQIITRVGENPYSFYGYQADGIFSSTTEASAAALSNSVKEQFVAGDVRFIDMNNDNIINENDKVILGSATPDFFGGFYTSFRYKGWGLASEFTYSYGNDAYNAVRRSLEAMDNFNNQSKAVLNRWQLDGQKTDVPRAVYGDPSDNNRFSSRWIEDASYLKVKNITLSYSFDKSVFNFFRSGTLYITGENLYTFTKYLGLDPEFAYSYQESLMGCDFAKVANPRSIKFGINLKF